MEPASHDAALGMIALALAGFLVAAVGLLRRVWTRDSTARRAASAATLAILATVGTLVALEFGFEHFVAQSESSNRTLASLRWFERYWKPINQLELRDPPIDPSVLDRTRVLVVLGDSFAAGHGVEREEQRASGVLRAALAPGWSVVTLARQGWDTRDETASLRDFPWRPDVVVLWWFLNDVLSAAAAHGLRFDPDFSVQPAWIAPLVDASSLANFVYWRLRPTDQLRASHAQFVARSFDDSRIWRTHEGELEELLALVRARRSRLIAVVFPDLADIEGSARFAGSAAAFFRTRAVPTLDVAKLFQGRPAASLVVNARDSHPNEAVHAELAERTLELLREEGLLSPSAPDPSR